MHRASKPLRNPHVLLREEFDDWAVLFDPDTGRGFGLNPTGVYVWKLLDGDRLVDDMLEEFRSHADGVPGDAMEHIRMFVDVLVAEGLAAYSDNGSYCEKGYHCSLTGRGEVTLFTYEAPRLINLNGPQTATGRTCTPHGSQAAYCCDGAGAATSCTNGASAATSCTSGTCPGGYSGNCYPTGNCPQTSYQCNSGSCDLATRGNDCLVGYGCTPHGSSCCGGC